ncbi:MAG: hypothetical protein U5N86_05080 [Planctomycetota bacterium]|nr:hypothetical protein [Planctomycetota bacterium]
MACAVPEGSPQKVRQLNTPTMFTDNSYLSFVFSVREGSCEVREYTLAIDEELRNTFTISIDPQRYSAFKIVRAIGRKLLCSYASEPQGKSTEHTGSNREYQYIAVDIDSGDVLWETERFRADKNSFSFFHEQNDNAALITAGEDLFVLDLSTGHLADLSVAEKLSECRDELLMHAHRLALLDTKTAEQCFRKRTSGEYCTVDVFSGKLTGSFSLGLVLVQRLAVMEDVVIYAAGNGKQSKFPVYGRYLQRTHLVGINRTNPAVEWVLALDWKTVSKYKDFKEFPGLLYADSGFVEASKGNRLFLFAPFEIMEVLVSNK